MKDAKKIFISTWENIDELKEVVNLCLIGNTSEPSLDDSNKDINFSYLHSIIEMYHNSLFL